MHILFFHYHYYQFDVRFHFFLHFALSQKGFDFILPLFWQGFKIHIRIFG